MAHGFLTFSQSAAGNISDHQADD